MVNMKTIPLTKGKVAMIDECDFEELSKYKWTALRAPNTWYAFRKESKTGRQILMHRQILNARADQLVDHSDHDGLDNRRCNISICSGIQNQGNRLISKNNKTGFKGVRFRAGKWECQISIKDKYVYLGRYDDVVTAAKRYDDAALSHFGAFALTNKKLGLYE